MDRVVRIVRYLIGILVAIIALLLYVAADKCYDFARWIAGDMGGSNV